MNRPWQNEDGTIDCPVRDWTCPYFKNGKCACDNVENNCDDFYYAWANEIDKEEDDDYDEEPYDLDMGFDPYMGCYTDDC